MAIRVRDLMTTDVVDVPMNADMQRIASLLRRTGAGALPVVDDRRRVVGMVSETDLLLKLAYPLDSGDPRLMRAWSRSERAKATALTALRLMTAPAVTLRQGETAAAAAGLLHRHRVHRLPVVDTEGHLVGMLGSDALIGVYTRDDTSLRDEIVRRLLVDFDLPRVRVEVDRGVVTLEGRVRLRSKAVAVRKAAQRVEGVVHVEDRLVYADDDLFPFTSALMPEQARTVPPRARY